MDRLTRLLDENGLSQATLADNIGLRRQTISDWKKNGYYPTADIAVKIAQELNTTVEYLVTGKDPSSSSTELERLKAKIKAFAATL